MLRLLTLSLFAAAALGACSPSAARNGPTPLPAQPGCEDEDAGRTLCIVVLGDSLASGEPLAGGDRWWVRLEAALTRALPGEVVHVDNWAVAGSRVDVLEAAATGQPQLGSYDIAIVIEGVNDERFTPMTEWITRYEAAIAAIEGRGVKPVLVTPPPSFQNGQFQTRYDGIADGVRQVARRGRALLDVAVRWRADGAVVAAAYYADLIHQNAIGQSLMADLASEVVLDTAGASG